MTKRREPLLISFEGFKFKMKPIKPSTRKKWRRNLVALIFLAQPYVWTHLPNAPFNYVSPPAASAVQNPGGSR